MCKKAGQIKECRHFFRNLIQFAVHDERKFSKEIQIFFTCSLHVFQYLILYADHERKT